MKEKEPRKEIIGRGELFFLYHPGTEATFSGYGLTVQAGNKELLVGLLMIDRPTKADPVWLEEVEAVFGGYQLEVMGSTGDRGILCQMQIEKDSLAYLRQFPGDQPVAIKTALQSLLDNLPNPGFILRWDEKAQLWRSEFAPTVSEPPPELREVFEILGYGCLAMETDVSVVHVCHAADADIESFADKPVAYQWQLFKMPTAPLIQLSLVIADDSHRPYWFESSLNVADEHQARILAQLANQEELYLVFYGDGFTYRFTKIIDHDRQQWQYLDELVAEAIRYWEQLPPGQRDFDRAKREFLNRFDNREKETLPIIAREPEDSTFRPQPEDVLTETEYELLQKAQAQEIPCPQCDQHLTGSFYFHVFEDGYQEKGVRLWCFGCGFEEY